MILCHRLMTLENILKITNKELSQAKNIKHPTKGLISSHNNINMSKVNNVKVEFYYDKVGILYNKVVILYNKVKIKHPSYNFRPILKGYISANITLPKPFKIKNYRP